MKAHVKFLFLLIITSSLFYVSYILSFLLNGRIILDSAFSGQVMPSLYYLIGIKIFVFTLFMLYQTNKYSYLRASLGLIGADFLSIMYLLFIGTTIDNYLLFGINSAIDLVLILVVILLFNLISEKSNTDEEIDDINKYMNSKKDLQDIAIHINQKKEELDFIDSMITKKEQELSNIKEKQSEREERSFIPANTIELQSLNCPVRIEFGDKSRCVAAYAMENGDTEKSKIIVDQKEIKATMEDIKNREEELDSRAKKIEKKELIIEKTVSNLEQISKTIKERMQLLDEKEIYINKQLKILEEKEDEYSGYVHNQIYETIFKAPDLNDHEVKLKDKSKEIIIDKNDLLEIRQMIEKAAES